MAATADHSTHAPTQDATPDGPDAAESQETGGNGRDRFIRIYVDTGYSDWN